MKKPAIQHIEPIRFIEFWLRVATDLGSSRLRINAQAKTIHELMDKDSEAREYLHLAIKKSYKLSRCQHLGSHISIECVLDILGETAYKLQSDKRDDLFDIELLEEIAWHISNHYLSHLSCESIESEMERAVNMNRQAGSAQVISFPDFKIRRANSRL